MDWISKARFLRGMIEKAAASLPDEDAVEAVELFPRWEVGVTYMPKDRVRHEDQLYECIQEHTSQDDWHPDIVPALWKRVAEPGEIPEWVQPAGAHDAYNLGDKVRHNGKIWISDIDANVWEPGVAGWSVVA